MKSAEAAAGISALVGGIGVLAGSTIVGGFGLAVFGILYAASKLAKEE